MTERQYAKAYNFLMACLKEGMIEVVPYDELVEEVRYALGLGDSELMIFYSYLKTRKSLSYGRAAYRSMLDLTGPQTAESLATLIIEHAELCNESKPDESIKLPFDCVREHAKTYLTQRQYEYFLKLTSEEFDELPYQKALDNFAEQLINKYRLVNCHAEFAESLADDLGSAISRIHNAKLPR